MSISTHSRPVFETYRCYRDSVAPQVDAAITTITGKTERDDDSVDGGKPRDELTTLGYKVCGAFALRAATAPLDVHAKDGSRILTQDEQFMSIHLLEVAPEDATIGYGRASLRQAADHIRTLQEVQGHTLASVTYAWLGDTANKAFGFEIAELPIEIDELEDPRARPVVAYMAMGDFLERY